MLKISVNFYTYSFNHISYMKKNIITKQLQY